MKTVLLSECVMDEPTSQFYARHAAKLQVRYGRPDPEAADQLLRAFEGARKILDVGCGTGRDLAFLLRKGKDAYGVDASPEMIGQARTHLDSQRLDPMGRLFVAALPALDLFDDAEFDGVLCSAVLMHLPGEQLFDAVYSLRRVLKPGGTLRVSVPLAREDVDPATRRDADGRLFTDLPPSKLQLLLERSGFSMVSENESDDSLGRPGIRWWSGDFRRMDESTETRQLVAAEERP